MLCRATQDRWVMMQSSEKIWSIGEGNGEQFQYSCLEDPMNSKKCKKKYETRDVFHRLVCTQYVTREEQKKKKKKKKNSPERMKEMMTSCVSGVESKG